MSELFKNAKFGDKYKTRDGRCAIYDFYDKDDVYGHQMLVENCGITYYNNDGRYDESIEDELDIISRWEEEIDKETLVLIGSFKDMCKTLNYNKGVYKKEYLEQMEKRCLAWIKEKAKQD